MINCYKLTTLGIDLAEENSWKLVVYFSLEEKLIF